MSSVHQYSASVSWSGTTSGGYEQYPRDHFASVAPSNTPLTLSGDAAFHGNPALMNPEQLLVLSAVSCQLLSFLAVAARARLDILEYKDTAHAEMPEDDPPVRITRIVLRPEITLRPGPTAERLQHLAQVAHRECYIANSLKTEVIVEPTFLFL